jgi:hypothetical protein
MATPLAVRSDFVQSARDRVEECASRHGTAPTGQIDAAHLDAPVGRPKDRAPPCRTALPHSDPCVRSSTRSNRAPARSGCRRARLPAPSTGRTANLLRATPNAPSACARRLSGAGIAGGPRNARGGLRRHPSHVGFESQVHASPRRGRAFRRRPPHGRIRRSGVPSPPRGSVRTHRRTARPRRTSPAVPRARPSRLTDDLERHVGGARDR